MIAAELCTYSDLPPSECHHCDPSPRPGDPVKPARQRRDADRADAEIDGTRPRWSQRREGARR